MFHICLIFFLTYRRFSELWKYHKFSAAVNMKAFAGIIKRIKKLQFLFPVMTSSAASPDMDSLLDSSVSSLHSSPSLSLSLNRRSLEPELDTRWVNVYNIPTNVSLASFLSPSPFICEKGGAGDNTTMSA